MILPEALKRSFWEELRTYEEERRMPYITSVEQIGIEKGIEKGERSMALRLLTRKFGELPDRTRDRINALSIKQIELLGDALLDFAVIGDLEHWLAEH
jgi:gluconate kinase